MEDPVLLSEEQAHIMYALDSHIKTLSDEEMKEFYESAQELLEQLDCLSDHELSVLLEEKNKVIEQIKAQEYYESAQQLLSQHLGKSAEVAGLEVNKDISLEF